MVFWYKAHSILFISRFLFLAARCLTFFLIWMSSFCCVVLYSLFCVILFVVFCCCFGVFFSYHSSVVYCSHLPWVCRNTTTRRWNVWPTPCCTRVHPVMASCPRSKSSHISHPIKGHCLQPVFVSHMHTLPICERFCSMVFNYFAWFWLICHTLSTYSGKEKNEQRKHTLSLFLSHTHTRLREKMFTSRHYPR